MKRWLMLGAAVLAVVLQVSGAGFVLVDEAYWRPPGIHPPHPPVPPYPSPQPHRHLFSPLEIKSIRVSTEIEDQVARTIIDQEFYNPNSGRLEGSFLLPVPKGAHIDRFTLQMDGKPLEAELLEAEKAKSIYEDIVRRSRDPALLQYVGADLYRVRVFPFEPRSGRRISFSFTQLLRSENNLTRLEVPLASAQFSSEPVRKLEVEISLETSRPLKTLYSPSHSLRIDRQGSKRATARLENPEAATHSNLALYFSTENDEVGLTLLTHRENHEDGYFLLLASPGMEMSTDKILPKDVVFVIDTSGSMAGKKIEQARNALEFCLESLNPQDQFEIVRFSTEVEPLFDGWAPLGPSERERARNFVSKLKAAGGTAIHGALSKALSLRPQIYPGRKAVSSRPMVVLFLTDGRPTVGPTSESEILRMVKEQVDSNIRIFSFGVGTDVNTHLLDKISEESRGATEYVLPEEDLEIKVSDFFAKINHPVLANPQLRFGNGVQVSKTYPSPLPDLFRGSQLVVAGRYTGEGDCAILLEGTVQGEKKTFHFEAILSAHSSENEFIPRLWATRRVGYLLDQIRLHGEDQELKEEVTQLARDYGIVTPYTAYLIVEDETRRNVPETSRSLIRLHQDRGAREAAAENWDSYKREEYGMAAVAAARANERLRSASAAEAGAAGGAMEANRALGLPPTQAAPPSVGLANSESKTRLAAYAQEHRFSGGKSFFLANSGWVDSEVQKHPEAPRVKLTFGSPDYFALIQQHPRVAKWLAMGGEVQFFWNGKIYEVGQ